MAIQFARCEHVSRSSGGNACRTAAYNKRDAVNCKSTGTIYYFKNKSGNVHHEVTLPCNADSKFKNPNILWNEVEKTENRINSQLFKSFVLALPDDPEISLDDKIEMSRQFVERYFTSRGVACQIDIHEPHEQERNWHAHLMVTTRRFSADGKNFHTHKARDLDSEVRKGRVVEAEVWGELWKDFQNQYFLEKGLELRVDQISLVPQEHLGPVRMRAHIDRAEAISNELKAINEQLSMDPDYILSEISNQKAVFTEQDIADFCQKHVPEHLSEHIIEVILDNNDLEVLYDKETNKPTGYITTNQVRAEEEKALRFAQAVSNRKSFKINETVKQNTLNSIKLSIEQQSVFDYTLNNDSNLKLIQGRAGVGKSYTIQPVRQVYEQSGYQVIGLAPTNKVARDLTVEGFKDSMTCHSALFKYKNNRLNLRRPTVFVIDEAAMLSTPLLVELLNMVKKTRSKVVMLGDSRQLHSIERGGLYNYLLQTFKSQELQEVRRQKIGWQKEISQHLSNGEIKQATVLLEKHNCLNWHQDKVESMQQLIEDWTQDFSKYPAHRLFIMATRNVDVDALNYAARDVCKGLGRVANQDFEIQTLRGRVKFAVGDRVQFALTDKEQGIHNGMFGTIKLISNHSWIITQDNGLDLKIDPLIYKGLKHGYAGTIYKAQGSTLDRTYVLHDKAANMNSNYVALTRHTEALNIYLNRVDTKNINAFNYQISRDGCKVTSLQYHTHQDLIIKQSSATHQTLKDRLLQKKHAIHLKIKDYLHSNPEFYERLNQSMPPQQQTKKIVKTGNFFDLKQESFTSIAEALVDRLQRIYYNKYACLPDDQTNKLQRDQAFKAAENIFSTYAHKQINPSLDEVNLELLCAKKELERIPSRINDYLNEVHANRDVRLDDCLIAKLYSQRTSTIESRLFKEKYLAFLNGACSKPPRDFSEFSSQADQEFKSNQGLQNKFAEKFFQQNTLPFNESLQLATLYVLHLEKHCSVPNSEQFKILVECATYCHKRKYDLASLFSDLPINIRENVLKYMIRHECDQFLSNPNLTLNNQDNLKTIQEHAKQSLKQELENAQLHLNKSRDINLTI